MRRKEQVRVLRAYICSGKACLYVKRGREEVDTRIHCGAMADKMSIVLSAERKAGVEIDCPTSLQSNAWCFCRSDYEPYLILQRGTGKRHLSVQGEC